MQGTEGMGGVNIIVTRETYTFSRALHLMRYGGKKMRFIGWQIGIYVHIVNGRLKYDCGGDGTLTQWVVGLKST